MIVPQKMCKKFAIGGKPRPFTVSNCRQRSIGSLCLLSSQSRDPDWWAGKAGCVSPNLGTRFLEDIAAKKTGENAGKSLSTSFILRRKLKSSSDLHDAALALRARNSEFTGSWNPFFFPTPSIQNRGADCRTNPKICFGGCARAI